MSGPRANALRRPLRRNNPSYSTAGRRAHPPGVAATPDGHWVAQRPSLPFGERFELTTTRGATHSVRYWMVASPGSTMARGPTTTRAGDGRCGSCCRCSGYRIERATSLRSERAKPGVSTRRLGYRNRRGSHEDVHGQVGSRYSRRSRLYMERSGNSWSIRCGFALRSDYVREAGGERCGGQCHAGGSEVHRPPRHPIGG
jgi:hypothetical protein